MIMFVSYVVALAIAGLAILLIGCIFGFKTLKSETPIDGILIIVATLFALCLLAGIGLFLAVNETERHEVEISSMAIIGVSTLGLIGVSMSTMFLFLTANDNK